MEHFGRLLIGVLIIYGIIQIAWVIYYFRKSPQSFHLPRRKKPTMFDVRRYIIQGKKDLAIKTYREIFGVREDQAVKEINELERGILKKN